ncbi:MAG TPA: hypothetical protein VGJ98_03060 [Candidatus Eisenbacteria bacterium]
MRPGPSPGHVAAKGPPWATYLVLPSYLIATVLFTWPLILNVTSAIPFGHGASDSLIQAFLLGWDWHAITTHPLGVFNAPIFFPEPNTLTYMDHLLGETLLAAPILAMTRSIPTAYNFLVLFSFVASAWAVYRLARFCGASRPGAYLAGFLYAFSPYRFANLDQLNQLQTEFLPLGILFGLKFLQRYRVRDLAALAGCLVVQVYFGWYYAYYLAIAIGLLLAYALVKRSLVVERMPQWRSAAIAAAALLLVLPVALPYIREHRLLPEFQRSLGESALYSADVLDYLKWNRNAALSGLLPFATGAQSYWPGLVTVLLGAVALGGGRLGRDFQERFRAKGYFLALTVASFLLSLGPILHVAGARIWIPLPYGVFYTIVPGFSSMRAPARFACLALLGLAILASFGFDRLRSVMRGRSAWRWVVVLLFSVSIAFSLTLPLSTVELPTEKGMPLVYAWLATRPGREPILELPVPRAEGEENETHALRQFYLLHHGNPRLDGTSGFVSRRYKEFRSLIQGFPSEEALRAAGGLGAKLIIVHFGDYPAAERERLRARIRSERGLVPLVEFGTDAVFRLQANPETRGGGSLTKPAAPPDPKTSSARFPAIR